MQRRSFLRTAAIAAGLPLMARPATLGGPPPPPPGEGLPVFDGAWPTRIAADTLPAGVSADISAQVRGYMQAMNAPGMTFALTDLTGHHLTAAFGYEQLVTRSALIADRQFQIGSISKSMATLCILQLVDEGRLSLDRPVLDYLPWLPWETPFGAVTLHHVLTHTSGLPDGGSLFFDNKAWVHKQAYAPGKRFFYSNMAFDTLAYLVEMCDGRSYQASLQARLFQPLGMGATTPLIGGPEWLREAVSYGAAVPDRPYTRYGALRQASPVHLDESAGCVASTAGDMAMYARFLARGGVTDGGRRLIREASFAKMTTPYVAAPEFGTGASYGYGIAVNSVDGDTILLHTGGMVSFASSIYINRTRGIAAFASINAMQGYRPTPVTQYAVEALAAAHGHAPAPLPVHVADDRVVDKPAAYTGRYTGAAGTVAITAQDGGLRLELRNVTVPLEGSGDSFDTPEDIALPSVPLVQSAMSWVFQRDASGVVTGLTHGPAWYQREGAPTPPASTAPPAGNAPLLTGVYVNDDPWGGTLFVFERQGRLYLNDTELVPRDDGSFTFALEPGCPDRVGFRCIVSGRARILLFDGTRYVRFSSYFEGAS